ncbi:MAG TPA: hypothetical protein VFT96_11990 [Gemmatimonadaceae bacterium]|nr:hypothetical protein [Gemmatimonadaceae bacterium]
MKFRPVRTVPIALAALFALGACKGGEKVPLINTSAADTTEATATGDVADTGSVNEKGPSLSLAEYNAKIEALRGDTASVNIAIPAGRSKRDSISLARAVRYGRSAPGWPVKGPAVKAGAILPARRIVAYYGNPLSKRMGALGEYETQDMLRRLDKEVAQWNAADPSHPVQPALHLIAVVAQGAAGRDGKWRTRMDSALIEKVYGWAQSHNALLFLDIQTGHSTYREELPRLMKWLERPNVHLGIDPEFNMHGNREGVRPGAKIGTLDAADINYVSGELARLVREKKLPPKVLVVHRFTRPMVTNYRNIRLDPNVQIVMHMDGWGGPWLKYDSYKDYILQEPVQFTGFKLFYHNDTKKGDKLLTANELVKLIPAPLYIQYQ